MLPGGGHLLAGPEGDGLLILIGSVAADARGAAFQAHDAPGAQVLVVVQVAAEADVHIPGLGGGEQVREGAALPADMPLTFL